ncbi:hypothetical protein [Edaphobacter acidisoli]|nr:hypothetical protein [Edaphobacter acidisoli]
MFRQKRKVPARMRDPAIKAGMTLASMLLFVFTTCVWAQTKPQIQPSTVSQHVSAPAKTTVADKQSTTAAAQLTPEQVQLQAQIDKLYQLAQDLKAAVAKSNKDTLSIDVIKKADAVEKSAKDLKDQMKSSQQTTNSH